MKERPILFNGDMVRAILDGRKTQTRRAVKGLALDWLDNAKFTPEYVASPDNCMSPYGQHGDRLWVRETFSAMGNAGCHASSVFFRADGDDGLHWTPSIHMPRWASRITLEIVSVRVERLNEISELDAVAEGVEPNCAMRDHSNCTHDEYMKTPQLEDGFPAFSATEAFQSLWESISGTGSWQQNPWVWVVEFKRADP